MTAHDSLSHAQFPGCEWRDKLDMGGQQLLSAWEKDPRAVGASQRAAFRRLVAPEVHDTVFRGDETVDGPYGIMPLDRHEARYLAMAETGQTVHMPTHSSASLRPGIAGGFRHNL